MSSRFRVNRLMLTLTIGLLSVSVIGQNGFVSKQAKVSRIYNDLSAVYAVVAADGRETVYCKFNNDGSQPALVVLTVTKASGGTNQRNVEVLPGGLASINIGDIASVSVSIAKLKEGENGQDRQIVDRAVLRDQLTKHDGKLTAIGFEKSVAEQPKTLGKTDRPQQTTTVLDIIFGKDSTTGLTLTEEDHKTADYFLKELVEGSCQMSLAKVLFETTYSFDPDILEIAVELAKSYGENCREGSKKGEYYRSVVDTIRAKYRTAFANRKQNGEWLMTLK